MKQIGFLVVCAIAAACGGDARAGDSSAGGATTRATTNTPAGPSVPVAVVSPATRLAAAKRISGAVSVQGVGPLHPGMSLARAVVVMEGDLWTHDRSLTCSYFRAARAPGMKFLFLDRYLARIEVDSGAAGTLEGAKIGATEAEVQALYAGRVAITQDSYTDARYLTVTPRDEAESAGRIVFETRGQRVTRFRAGPRPFVEWVKGCG